MRFLPILAAALFVGTLLPLTPLRAQPTKAAAGVAESRPSPQTTLATLDRMIANGTSQQALAQYVFDTHGCRSCHTVGKDGKLGFTEKGKQVAAGFEGCVSMLTAMTRIAQVREGERSPQQRLTATRFEEFGCTLCHKMASSKMGLTEVGSRLTHLHLGCVEIENLVAGKPSTKR